MIELIGFEKEFSDLLYRYESNNLPNSILIHGLSGIGKRTFLNKLVKNILKKIIFLLLFPESLEELILQKN